MFTAISTSIKFLSNLNSYAKLLHHLSKLSPELGNTKINLFGLSHDGLSNLSITPKIWTAKTAVKFEWFGLTIQMQLEWQTVDQSDLGLHFLPRIFCPRTRSFKYLNNHTEQIQHVADLKQMLETTHKYTCVIRKFCFSRYHLENDPLYH